MSATSSRVSFIGLALVGLSTQVALAGTEAPALEGELEEYEDGAATDGETDDEEDTATDAELLFATGFEDCTDLSTVEEYFDVKGYENNRQGALQYFSGHDRATDFSWPPDLTWLSSEYPDLDGVAAPIYINNQVGIGDMDDPTHEETTHYMWNELVETVDSGGYETRALSMTMMNNPDATETGQNNLVMRFADDDMEAPALYIKYSMKPSEWIYEALHQRGTRQNEKEDRWHLISEMKADDSQAPAGEQTRFRLQVLISINKGDRRPSYQLRADFCGPDEYTGEFVCSNPEYWSVVEELTDEEHRKWKNGEWMPVEIYLDRSPAAKTDTLFYVAINGRTIGDISADDINPETGDTFEFWDEDDTPQSYWLLQTLYGLRTVVEEDPAASDYSVLIDDLELWDDFPCTKPPCAR